MRNSICQNHVIAALFSTDPNLPLNLLYKLDAQYIITLNLFRKFLINTKLSAHSQVFGNFNYYRTPMYSPGIKCFIRVPYALAITVIYNKSWRC